MSAYSDALRARANEVERAAQARDDEARRRGDATMTQIDDWRKRKEGN